MGLRDFLFINHDIEYKRDVPENIRQDIHRLLDKVLDTGDYTNSCCLSIELSKKLDSVRELYPIRKYRKENKIG